MYRRVRESPLSLAERCIQFRRDRDELFRRHPQSALTEAQKARFAGLRYFPCDPSLRLTAPLEPPTASGILEVPLRDEGLLRLQRIGVVRLNVGGQRVELTVFWVLGYGGGIFLPFTDATSHTTTYPGGRYLLDTLKGADLGSESGRLVLDFNYAYNPSCAYNPRWDCPLTPPENVLPVEIRAGEQRYPEGLTVS
jgi:uncharacterized protein (DUF1684 family)